jgi:5-methylcytosine-specific restriction endonuclease McrA
MKRKALNLKAKVAAFAANALCPKCFKPFDGDVEFDHDIPLGLAGKDYDEVNLVPLCSSCHADKTKSDIRRIAKAKRSAGETGQRARREKRKAAGTQDRMWPKGRKIQSRGFEK